MRTRRGYTVFALALGILLAMGAKGKKEEPKAKPAPGGAEGGDVVAYLGDQPITKGELDKMIASRLMQIRQQEYDIRRDGLDQIVTQRLLEKESKARGLSVPDLLKAEVDDKAPTPTKEEIDQFYERNKARFGDRTREQVGPEIERNLRQPKLVERRNAFYAELKAKAQVKVLLDPPRTPIAVPENAPSQGGKAAPVTIVEFSDFQCGFCKRAQATVDQILQIYGDKVRLVYRDYPLAFHQRALPASKAAFCAGDQGKYWEYHSTLMKTNSDLSDDDLKKKASELGLDAAAFAACYASDRHDGTIKAAMEDGSGAGVTGTPTFFVNGRMMVGAKPLEEFKTLINEELERAGVAPPSTAKTQ